jgi:hypothetical protein
VLNKVLWQVLQPITFKQHPRPESGYFNILCPDGNFRRFNPVLATWLADSPEYSDLPHLERHVCFWCECPKNQLEDDMNPDNQHARRDHNQYRTLSDANKKEADATLSSHHVHRGFDMFQPIPSIGSDVPKLYLLHPMQIEMLDHLQKWIQNAQMA